VKLPEYKETEEKLFIEEDVVADITTHENSVKYVKR